MNRYANVSIGLYCFGGCVVSETESNSIVSASAANRARNRNLSSPLSISLAWYPRSTESSLPGPSQFEFGTLLNPSSLPSGGPGPESNRSTTEWTRYPLRACKTTSLYIAWGISSQLISAKKSLSSQRQNKKTKPKTPCETTPFLLCPKQIIGWKKLAQILYFLVIRFMGNSFLSGSLFIFLWIKKKYFLLLFILYNKIRDSAFLCHSRDSLFGSEPPILSQKFRLREDKPRFFGFFSRIYQIFQTFFFPGKDIPFLVILFRCFKHYF